MPSLRTVLAAIVLLLAVAPLGAQTDTARTALDTARIHGVLDDACPGARVRLHLASRGMPEGRCGPVVDGRLVIDDGSAAGRTVALETIRQVWVRERQTADGALVGAGIGAGTMALVGILFVSGLCETDDCTGDYVRAIPLVTLMGGGAGLLAGGVLGWLTKDWERKFP